MDTKSLHSSYVTGFRIDEALGRYRLSCKVGTYCLFGYEQVSNQRHRHDCYELCIIMDGKGSFIYNDTEYRLQKGDIIIADPGVGHEIQANMQENLLLLYIFLEINGNRRTAAGKTYGEICVEGFLRGHRPKVSQEQLLAYLTFIEAYNSPKRKMDFGTYEALKNLVIECLGHLSENSGSHREETVKNIVEHSLDYIDANLHKRIPVSDVAADCCTTPRNLEYLFRKHLGKTVVGYINEKKIDLACHYLSMYFNITDAANMVGISNPSHFSALFKKYRFMSPRQYQNTCSLDRKGMGRRIQG